MSLLRPLPLPRLGPLTALLLVTATVPGLVLASPSAAARARADLTVASLATDAATVVAGRTITVTDTVRNRGRAKAGKSRTRYHLSKNDSLGRGDTLLATRKVGALRPGKEDAGSVRVTVPAATRARSWHLLACADAKAEVRESKEGNNCRAVRVSVTEDTGVSFPMEPNPLDVDSTVQTGRAVTRTAYSHEATSITATAADGTTYTLEIPAEALLGPEDITLTPVASVDGLPLSGGMRAAVQIEPHGLMLLRPARLTIESPDLGPLAQQTGFLFHENGADAHSYPMAEPEPGDDADVVRMTLTHFSTPGVGSGSAAEQGDLAARTPSRAQSQVAAVISGLLSQERAALLSGADPDPAVAAQVEALMNQFHDDVVRQQMIAAETDKSLAAEAIALGLGWSRQMLLLGDEDNPRHDEISQRAERILHNVMDESWADCLDHDLRMVLDLLRVARAAALLNYDWQGEAGDKAFGCGRFEVRFESIVDASHSWSGNHQNGSQTGHWATTGTVHTDLWPGNATGPLGWRSFSYTMQNTITDPDSTCHISETGTGTAPGQLRANAVPMLESLNAFEGGGEPPPVPVFATVSLAAGAQPTETYRHTSCDGSSTTITDSRWAGYYEETGKTWTTDPANQQDDFLDSKEWTISDVRPGSSTSERTIVEVWHKPAL